MKVLMLNYEFPPLGGGAANANLHILNEFAGKKGLEIDLIVSSVSTFRIEQFADNITIHFLDIGKSGNLHNQSNAELLKYSFKAHSYIKKLRKQKNFDLVHAFFGIPCGFVGLFTQLPLIVSLRGSDVPGYSKRFALLDFLLFKRLSKYIWKKSAFTIANSVGLRALARQASPKQKIDLIPNGVDVSFWQPSSNQQKNDKFHIVSVGRLIPRKGFNFLIEALSGTAFQLSIAGDGPDRESLAQLATEQNVKLTLRGKLDKEEIRDLLQTADLFVLPSLNEGMSNAVLEAMACGLPIVMTDVGGAELIQENGVLIPLADAQALREAILSYANDRALCACHGLESRKIAEAQSWSWVADGYFSVYSKITNLS